MPAPRKSQRLALPKPQRAVGKAKTRAVAAATDNGRAVGFAIPPARARGDGDADFDAGKGAAAHGPNDDLTVYVERLVQLEGDRRAATADMKIVLDIAAKSGFHKQGLRDIVRRKLETADEAAKRREFEEARDAMLARLGMLADLPLGQAAAAAFSQHAQ